MRSAQAGEMIKRNEETLHLKFVSETSGCELGCPACKKNKLKLDLVAMVSRALTDVASEWKRR